MNYAENVVNAWIKTIIATGVCLSAPYFARFPTTFNHRRASMRKWNRNHPECRHRMLWQQRATYVSFRFFCVVANGCRQCGICALSCDFRFLLHDNNNGVLASYVRFAFSAYIWRRPFLRPLRDRCVVCAMVLRHQFIEKRELMRISRFIWTSEMFNTCLSMADLWSAHM